MKALPEAKLICLIVKLLTDKSQALLCYSNKTKIDFFSRQTTKDNSQFCFYIYNQLESLLKAKKQSFNDRIPLVILRDSVRRFKRKGGAFFNNGSGDLTAD